MYREFAPPPDLAPYVACVWATVHRGGVIFPDGCVDLVWHGTHLVVAGPATGPLAPLLAVGDPVQGVRFRLGVAGTALGLPAGEFADATVPVGLIYLASRIADSSQPSAGPYLLVLIGLPIGMALVGKFRGYLDRRHGRLTGREEERHRATWLRSMRAERTSTRRGSVLDQVMIVSVGLALVAFGIWFFGFAGSSLPTN